MESSLQRDPRQCIKGLRQCHGGFQAKGSSSQTTLRTLRVARSVCFVCSVLDCASGKCHSNCKRPALSVSLGLRTNPDLWVCSTCRIILQHMRNCIAQRWPYVMLEHSQAAASVSTQPESRQCLQLDRFRPPKLHVTQALSRVHDSLQSNIALESLPPVVTNEHVLSAYLVKRGTDT